jgi:hypothetical protein
MSERTANIELIEMIGSEAGERWSTSIVLDAQGSKLRVGSGSNADIVLPRERYVDLGRAHFALVFLPGRMFYESFHPNPPAKLDGKSADGATFSEGEHALSIGDHHFQLVVKLSDPVL